MLKTVRGQRVDTVIVLIVFCVFAVSVLLVLMLGANTYGSITQMSREDHAGRTVLSYIWTKVRNSDELGDVRITDFHGLQALYVGEEYGGVRYSTLIYHYNGWIYELFCEADLEFEPIDGVKTIMLESLLYEELGHGLIMVSSGGRNLLISPRSIGPDADYLSEPAEEVIFG